MKPGKITHSSKRLLNEISSEPTKDLLGSINMLLNELEEKPDPEPKELYLVENIYQLLEKFKVLENNLKNYVNNDRKNLPGNVLSRLTEE
jgi:hypothetical protein